ncbi:MAG: STAS domain-containing protein [Anaerotignum sp.]|nr:STAS domain-containing protein [Anaerotignum sp.]MCI8868214.1 STAS domain-containing protein [Anaerotignum sp.]
MKKAQAGSRSFRTQKRIIDANNIDALKVSSAGLRALLIGQKTANSKKGAMKLVHVPPILMSVLEVSGFVNILTIQ